MLSFITRLPIGLKLKVMFGALLVIIAGFSGAYWLQTKESIRFSEMEVIGNAFIRETRPLLKFIPQHRGNTNAAMNGNRTAQDRLPGLRQQAAAAFAALKQFPADQAEALKIGNRVTELESRWQRLSQGHSGRRAPDVFAEHTALIADIRGLIAYVGDTSNLILDPELDSYYLMDVVVLRSPSLGEYAGQARGLGAGIVARGSITPTEQKRLNALRIRLGDAFDGMTGSLKTAGANNPDVAAALSADLAQLNEKGQEAQAMIDQVLTGNFTGLDSTTYFDLMTSVIGANGAAVENAATLLDGLLDVRIGNMAFTLYKTLAIVAVLMLLTALGTYFALNQATAVIARANRHFQGIQEGDLEQTIEVTTNDDYGQMLEALATMQTQLRETREREQAELTVSRRIKQGLDSVNTQTMIADADGNIVYLNDAAKSLMRASEANLKSVLKGFDASKIEGSNFDIFHANPAHQRNLLGNLTQTHKAEITVAGQIFGLTASPVFDDDGKRLGTIVEWDERTEERQIEEEIASVVKKVSQGDLSQRVVEAGKEGFNLTLAKGINSLASTSAQVISETNHVMSAMAQGDLTQRLSDAYQGEFKALADNINEANRQMTQTVEQILRSSEQIRAGAEEIAQGNSDLSHRTEEQASSLEETASSMEQMTGLVRQTAENARNVNGLTNEVAQSATAGGEVVAEAVRAMEEINQSSKQISDIITVIDEIAFQTNLLALNAAVEAARAGEQGRGFAVVAGEVRSLAQRSAEAAKEIKDLIRDSSTKVEDGSQLVSKSGETLQQLVASISEVAGRMGEITRATDEQSSGIEQVNTAIAQMDEMTQQNAALVEEASAAGENMAEQARAMVSVAGVFKVDANSQPMGAVSAPARKPAATPKPVAKATPASPSSAHPVSDDDDWDEF